MRNIYLDTQEFGSIDSYLSENEGDFGSEEMEAAFDRLNLSLPDNIEKTGLAYLEIKTHEAVIKGEIERLRQLLTKEQTKADNIKKSLKYALLTMGIEKMPFDLFSVSVRKIADKLPDDIDEKLVPDNCFNVVPETRKLDRARLLKRCKGGPIDGIDLLTGRTTAVIS